MNEFDESAMTQIREMTYSFLSGLCLRPPSDSMIDMIKDGSILSLFLNDDESKSFSEMTRFVNETSKMENILDELTAEHASLFSLPSNYLPHEAVYLDKESRLGGRVTISVSQFYKKAGADIFENCIEMPDHIGMELEFMAFLCSMERKLREKADYTALDNCIYLQKSFLEEHLLKWVCQCCEKIIERATYGFYKAIAYMVMEFMDIETEYFAGLDAEIVGGYGLRRMQDTECRIQDS